LSAEPVAEATSELTGGWAPSWWCRCSGWRRSCWYPWAVWSLGCRPRIGRRTGIRLGRLRRRAGAPAACSRGHGLATLPWFDAWFDVLTSSTRTEFGLAITEAALVELPLTVLCLLLARKGARRLRLQSHDPHDSPLPRVRLLHEQTAAEGAITRSGSAPDAGCPAQTCGRTSATRFSRPAASARRRARHRQGERGG
jgi:hypothetical protein